MIKFLMILFLKIMKEAKGKRKKERGKKYFLKSSLFTFNFL